MTENGQKRKRATFLWNGLQFEFRTEISADFLYLASYNSLYLDNDLLLRSGGFNFRENAAGTFLDKEGTEHRIEYETRNLIDIWQPVSVRIDDKIVYQGAAPIKGLLNAVLIYFPIGFLLGIILGKLLGVLQISFPG